MILSYSHYSFVPAILQRTKIHTLRKDPTGRWKRDVPIQHWLGSPRNTSAKIPPFQFHQGVCAGVQHIRIRRCLDDYFSIRIGIPQYMTGFYQWSHMHGNDMRELCRNDGLSRDEFMEWFLPPGIDLWQGKIIHFTHMRYHGTTPCFNEPAKLWIQ